MKKFISILSLVAVLLMSVSLTSFAATAANEFTISTDVTSAKAGDAVYVTIDLTGDFTNAAMIQYSIKFDADKFSAVTSGRAPWCFDATWYNSTKDGNPANLGYINTPSVGANPVDQLNVLFVSADGYYIDDAGELYGDDKATVAGKIKFTAKADVDAIDTTCFELINAKVLKEDGSAHTVTVNQLASNDEPIVPDVETVEMAAPAYVTEAAASEEEAGWQKGQGVALKFTVADLADFVAMNWKLTCENLGTKYAKVADEAFAAIKASDAETIDVFASFIVNTKDAKDTVNTITAVGAGFKKADGTVVETK